MYQRQSINYVRNNYIVRMTLANKGWTIWSIDGMDRQKKNRYESKDLYSSFSWLERVIYYVHGFKMAFGDYSSVKKKNYGSYGIWI